MLQIKEYQDAPLFKALKELNDWMQEHNMSGLELNVVGGCALMIHGLRNPYGYTDIDYVGPKLARTISEASDDIGVRNGLGRGWINNDLMLTGSTLEDFEFSAGKLRFYPAFELSSIKINVIDPEDLLRMKLISIDTAATAVELGGDFTRAKDLGDIACLLERNGITSDDIQKRFGDYLINEHTPELVKIYETAKDDHAGIEDVRKFLRKISYENMKREFEPDELKPDEHSAFIDNVLNQAFEKSKEREIEF